MKRIVIVYGGKSSESEISVLTSLKVYKELKKTNNQVYLVYLDQEGNFYSSKNLEKVEAYSSKDKFKKVNFYKKKSSYYFASKFKRTYFDLVLILGHGKNIEDGTLSSYFETLNIPYIYDDLTNVSLFMDKVKTKLVFKALDIKVTNYQIVHSYEVADKFDLDFSYPLIIKPSRLGSSIGIIRVNKKEDLLESLIKGFTYDETLLIEEYIEDKVEYNIALLGYQNKILFSEIEEVNSSKEVLTFYDKYDYTSNNKKRIIYPQIECELIEEIKETSKTIFNKLNLCGLYRFDFIFDKKRHVLYLNEVNSLPGSLAYYLFEKQGISLSELVYMYIDILTLKNRNRNKLSTSFLDGFISKVDIDKLKK